MYLSMIPKIAIVGRPNVGKSSLFNRLIGKTHAIVTDVPGTTRDSVETIVRKKGKIPFLLADTAGIIELIKKDEKEQELETNVQEHVKLSMESADILMFVVDGKEQQFLATDYDVVDMLRRAKKPIIFVVNKCDSEQIEMQAQYVASLGFRDPVFISVSHKKNLNILEKRIQKELMRLGFDETSDLERKQYFLKLALIGTPNVGKSTLFNAILGHEKAIVSDVAGTTRDTFDTEITVRDQEYLLIDTAGIRRRGKIEKGIEKLSVYRTEKAIKRADVCLLVLDATRGVTNQDQQVASYILEENKGLIIIVNKWDMIKSKDDFPMDLRVSRNQVANTMDQYVAYLRFHFPFLPWAPVVFTDAIHAKNLPAIFTTLEQIKEEREKRVETGQLNRFIERVVEKHKPTGMKAYIPKISYVSQVAVNPPHFVFFVNDKKFFHFSYSRYLENMIREKFSFSGTPIVIELRNKTKKDYRKDTK